MPNSSLSDAERLERTASQLFMIVGAGRCGTSLLQAMVCAHPDAVMPVETHFLYSVYEKHKERLGDLRSPGAYDEAINLVLNAWWLRDIGLRPERFRELSHAGDKSWRTLFLALLTDYSELTGRPRVGDKSPGHFWYFDLLKRWFPEARIVHLVRDPRAALLSHMQAFGATIFSQRLRIWKESVDAHRRFAKIFGPEHYMLLRYEELVSDSETALRAVCDLFQLEFSESMLRHEAREVKSFGDHQARHMANTLKPVFTSSLEKWRSELSPRKVAIIEHEAGDEMEELGYPLTGATTYFPRVQRDIIQGLFLLKRVYRRTFRPDLSPAGNLINPDHLKPVT